jgi:hypothetical protein
VVGVGQAAGALGYVRDGTSTGRGISELNERHRGMTGYFDSVGSGPARLLRWRNTFGALGQAVAVASYSVNPDGVAWARHLIDTGQYVLDSDWGKVQPGSSEQNAFLKSHSWQEYARWHLGLTDGARDETKARYAFVYGDFRRLHRMGIIACQYRAAEWRHKDVELAAHDLLQRLDARHT